MCSAPWVPIAEVIRIAHERGIPVLVDAAQSAVHMPVMCRRWMQTFWCSRGTRFMASGIGVLYGKKELLEATMPPFLGGGAMIESVSVDDVTYAPPAGRGSRPVRHRSWRLSGWRRHSIT